MKAIRAFFYFCLVLCWTGCVSYQAQPLDPLQILEEVERSRNLLHTDLFEPEGQYESGMSDSFPFGFPEVAKLMSQYSPALLKARAEFNQAWSVAQIETPLPNPEIAFGPLYGTRIDPEGSSYRVQHMVEFGFSIPLSARLEFQDDLNKALDLNPNDISCLYWIDTGLVARCPDQAFREGILKLAERAFEVTDELDCAHSARGVLYAGHGQFDLALEDLGKSLSLEPDDWLVNYWYALVQLSAGHLDAYREACVELPSRRATRCSSPR